MAKHVFDLDIVDAILGMSEAQLREYCAEQGIDLADAQRRGREAGRRALATVAENEIKMPPWSRLPTAAAPGRFCVVCGGEQRHCSSGWVCEQGHGGADWDLGPPEKDETP